MTTHNETESKEVIISTHMPLARHDSGEVITSMSPTISTHMPLARHDLSSPTLKLFRFSFLLTCLLRGMTPLFFWYLCSLYISTHMPLARHDTLESIEKDLYDNFYSHASCEAWHRGKTFNRIISNFYSHASCEAWLSSRYPVSSFMAFLLTCLLRGMTARVIIDFYLISNFYSHASCEAWPD